MGWNFILRPGGEPSNRGAATMRPCPIEQGGRSMIAALVPLAFFLAQATPDATPPPRPAATGPVVVLETTVGTIRIALYKDQAPVSVDNFLKYVRARHYDGTIFHRVIPAFMAQGGGFPP